MISGAELRELASTLLVIETIALLPRASSTNDLGKRAVVECLENDLPLPTSLIIATEQTAGRGRGSNQWYSPSGGIYATLLQSRPRDRVGLVPLEIAVAVAQHLRASYQLAAQIKWPNDIVIAGRKIAGILVEARTSDSTTYLTIGIGLNLSAAGAGLPNATSLAEELGERIESDRAIRDFIRSLDKTLFAAPDNNEILRQWREFSSHQPGQPLSARVQGRVIEGRWLGIDDFGRACLETPTGVVEITAGEIIQQN